MLLNFVGKDAIEALHTLKWTNVGDKEKLDTDFEKFKQHCNPRKNDVLERYQFWTFVQANGEIINKSVPRLKGKVKSC